MSSVGKTKEEWLEWILKIGNGSLPSWPWLKREYPEKAAQILRDVGTWSQIELALRESKEPKKPTQEVILVGKKPKKTWPHTAEELWELVLQECETKGKVPSRRYWTHHNFFEYQELVDVLGYGNEQRFENELQSMWDRRHPPKQPEVAPEVSGVQGVGAVAQSKRGGSRKIVRVSSNDQLLDLIEEMQREFNLGDKIPTDAQIKQYHSEHPDICPSVGTFKNRMGDRWRIKSLLEQRALDRRREAQKKSEEVAEEGATPGVEKTNPGFFSMVEAAAAVEEPAVAREEQPVVEEEQPVVEEQPVMEGQPADEEQLAPDEEQPAATISVTVHTVRLDATINGRRQAIDIEFG